MRIAASSPLRDMRGREGEVVAVTAGHGPGAEPVLTVRVGGRLVPCYERELELLEEGGGGHGHKGA